MIEMREAYIFLSYSFFFYQWKALEQSNVRFWWRCMQHNITEKIINIEIVSIPSSNEKSLIGQFGKYHNTLCLCPQILRYHCYQFLLGLTMVPRENKNNAYAKSGGTNKEYYGIFRSGLFKRIYPLSTGLSQACIMTSSQLASQLHWWSTTPAWQRSGFESPCRLFFRYYTSSMS